MNAYERAHTLAQVVFNGQLFKDVQEAVVFRRKLVQARKAATNVISDMVLDSGPLPPIMGHSVISSDGRPHTVAKVGTSRHGYKDASPPPSSSALSPTIEYQPKFYYEESTDTIKQVANIRDGPFARQRLGSPTPIVYQELDGNGLYSPSESDRNNTPFGDGAYQRPWPKFPEMDRPNTSGPRIAARAQARAWGSPEVSESKEQQQQMQRVSTAGSPTQLRKQRIKMTASIERPATVSFSLHQVGLDGERTNRGVGGVSTKRSGGNKKVLAHRMRQQEINATLQRRSGSSSSRSPSGKSRSGFSSPSSFSTQSATMPILATTSFGSPVQRLSTAPANKRRSSSRNSSSSPGPRAGTAGSPEGRQRSSFSQRSISSIGSKGIKTTKLRPMKGGGAPELDKLPSFISSSGSLVKE